MKMNKILVVEDSEFLQFLLKSRLEQNGYSVTMAGTFADAMNCLKNPEDYLAAILDYTLPDAQRGEIIRAVSDKKVPSIVFTANVSTEVRDKIWESSVVDYYLKNDVNSLDNIMTQLGRLQRNHSIKVLVVDDSSFYRKVVSDLLQVHRFDILTATDGQNAIDILKKKGQDIKLLITDYSMPDINGIEVVKEARNLFSRDEMGIIGFSAVGENMMAAEFLKNGANDFMIKKQFLAEEFYTRVNQCLDYIENINRIKEVSDHKDRILGVAAHDLRNPIGSISGFSKLLLTNNELDNASQTKFLQTINSVSEDLLLMLDDLLDVSQIRSGKFNLDRKDCDLGQLLEERVELLIMAAANKDMTITTDLKSPVSAKVDPSKIGQVLDNFISNAIKYSPLGSEIHCLIEKSGTTYRVGVKDEGPGISEEEQDKLFGEFSRLSTKSTGGERSTGLGLAISKRIVEAHGGTIGVISNVGEGSTFFFEIDSKGTHKPESLAETHGSVVAYAQGAVFQERM